MKQYIVTFCSHFGATQFKHTYEEGMGVKVTLMPVPRYLSSSCGTCAFLEADGFIVPEDKEEIEQIVILGSSNEEQYEVVFSSDEE